MTDRLRVCSPGRITPFGKMLTRRGRRLSESPAVLFCHPSVLFALLLALSITSLLCGKTHNPSHTHTHTHTHTHEKRHTHMVRGIQAVPDFSRDVTEHSRHSDSPVSQTWKSEGRRTEERQRENTGLSCRRPSVSKLQKKNQKNKVL